MAAFDDHNPLEFRDDDTSSGARGAGSGRRGHGGVEGGEGGEGAETPTIDGLFDGELGDDETSLLFEHIRRDRGLVREVMSTQRALDALGDVPACPDFTGSVLGAVDRRRGLLGAGGLARLTVARVAVAAGLLVACAGVYMVHRSMPALANPDDPRVIETLALAASKEAGPAMDGIASGVRPSVFAADRLTVHFDLDVDGAIASSRAALADAVVCGGSERCDACPSHLAAMFDGATRSASLEARAMLGNACKLAAGESLAMGESMAGPIGGLDESIGALGGDDGGVDGVDELAGASASEVAFVPRRSRSDRVMRMWHGLSAPAGQGVASASSATPVSVVPPSARTWRSGAVDEPASRVRAGLGRAGLGSTAAASIGEGLSALFGGSSRGVSGGEGGAVGGVDGGADGDVEAVWGVDADLAAGVVMNHDGCVVINDQPMDRHLLTTLLAGFSAVPASLD